MKYLLAFLLTFALMPGLAMAQTSTLDLELNALDQTGADCRISLLLKNGLQSEIENLELELALFDTDGRIIDFLTFGFSPMPPAKSRIVQFDLLARECTKIGRVLINDVPACTGAELDRATCLNALAPTTRTGIDFSL